MFSILYNFIDSFTTFHSLINALNASKKHLIVKNFNFHQFYWDGLFKIIQHVMTNLLLNIIENRKLNFTLSKNIITWEKNTQFNIIDLKFMSKSLRKIVIMCETKNDLNQSSNHIFIVITLQIKSKKTKI